MIQSINGSADSFLADIDRLQIRAERAQRQLTSGLRVAVPSDDPDQVGAIVQLGSLLAHVTQVGHNLDQVKTEVDTGEQVISTAVSTLEKISVLAAQGANFTQTASMRAGLAKEVQDLFEQLVAAANTSVGGRYIFAGDADQAPAYGLNPASPTGTTPYLGLASNRQVELPRGGTFPVSQTAQQIFEGPGAAGAFAAVSGLRAALLANDQAGIEAAAGALRSAHDHLGQSLTYYGAIQNEVESAISDAKVLKTRYSANLASLREADLVGASVELNQSQLALDAAFSARARTPRTSLFNYLG
jgi:flagellar hook-associated protein 3 FlgL